MSEAILFRSAGRFFLERSGIRLASHTGHSRVKQEILRSVNLLYYGDNFDVLQRHVKDESVDLVYLDPPFNSNQSYNVLFAERSGAKSSSQIRAFEDTWTWDQTAAESYQYVMEQGGDVTRAMQAFRTLLGDSNMMAYLAMMAPRLMELKRVLKTTGSLYLHCDPTAGHYLKVLTDSIFAPINFRNEIVWRRTGSNSAGKRYGPIHQTIFYYVKSADAPFYPQPGPYTKGYVEDYFTETDERGRYRPVLLTGPGTRTGESGKAWRHYNPTSSGRHWQPSSYVYGKYQQLAADDLANYPLLERLDKLDGIGLIHWGKKAGGVPNYKYYLADAVGVMYQDIWGYVPGTEGAVYGRPNEGMDQDVKWLTAKDKERLGYPTQKPEGILERIIRCSSKEGDTVLDPFCGCGTTIAVAERLNRNWIGIDITHLAINLIKVRLLDRFEGKASYKVIGEPVSIEDADQLAQEDPYQFQWWALGLVGARPAEGKKGADKGIDGRIYFHDEGPKGKTKQIIFSVKAGKTQVSHLRDLRGVIDRENAEIGVLISMQEPSGPMRKEAAGAGFYSSPWGNHPRLQLVTVGQLLDGKRIDAPPLHQASVTFRKAPKAAGHVEEAGNLFDSN